MTDRAEEIDDALTIIHDRFVSAGYMAPQPSGRRLIPSYLNSGTCFAIAYQGDEALGAVALVTDGAFGLPADRAFVEEIDEIRAWTPGPVLEISSLSLVPGRPESPTTYIHLMAAIGRLTLRECPESPVLLCVTPAASRLCISLFGCRQLAGPRPLFGAPAVLLLTDGRTAADAVLTQRTTRHQSVSRLLHQTFPRWLSEHREQQPWPATWLRPLLAESGLPERLSEQVSLLDGPSPRERELDRGAFLLD